MLKLLSRSWWALVMRGILSVLFGVAAISWPGITILSLLILFGAYALFDGIVLVLHAITGRGEHSWLLFIQGLIGIGIGLLTFKAPGTTALGLLLYIAARTLVTGVLDIMAAIALRKEMEGEFWLLSGGVASVLFAVLLIAAPVVGVLAIVWIVAPYAIFFGALIIVLGFKLREAGRRLREATA